MDPIFSLGLACTVYTALELRAAARRARRNRAPVAHFSRRAWRFDARDAATGRPISVETVAG